LTRYQHATEDRDKSIANAMADMVQADVRPITAALKRKA
jgi:hypothetical protein